MKLSVLGHTAYDYIFDVPYHPQKGYSIFIKNYSRHYGGGGANICYGASQLGLDCRLVSSFGKDCMRYERHLKRSNIELHVYRSSKKMARAFIFNAEEQISYFYWGASEDMDKIKAVKSDYLHIAPSHPVAAMKMASHAKFFSFEPGQDIPRYEKEQLLYLIEHADIIFCNEFELKKLERIARLEGKEVIVTMGKRGCMIYRNGKKIPSIPQKAVDPTGAGDAFKAAFWTMFLKGYDIEQCCKMANKAASIIVRYRGGQNRTAWRKISKMVKNNINGRLFSN